MALYAPVGPFWQAYRRPPLPRRGSGRKETAGPWRGCRLLILLEDVVVFPGAEKDQPAGVAGNDELDQKPITFAADMTLLISSP
jgi:hypothetical protein